MKYAVYMAATDRTMSLVDVAQAAEERCFESIWIPEHVHIPVDRNTPYPFTPDGSLPDTHFRLPDPLGALAAVAGATSEIKLGTGICLVTEHEPIALAKSVASLDYISGG
ncbi:MAG: LLM class flavin-dependent oxidoreductase, partial [Dehalococcoidia bacterium]